MITFNDAKQKIQKAHKDSNVIGSYKMDDGFLFSLKPKEWKDEDYVLDGLFKVSNTGIISEYSPVMNPEEFKETLRNQIK